MIKFCLILYLLNKIVVDKIKFLVGIDLVRDCDFYVKVFL